MSNFSRRIRKISYPINVLNILSGSTACWTFTKCNRLDRSGYISSANSFRTVWVGTVTQMTLKETTTEQMHRPPSLLPLHFLWTPLSSLIWRPVGSFFDKFSFSFYGWPGMALFDDFWRFINISGSIHQIRSNRFYWYKISETFRLKSTELNVFKGSGGGGGCPASENKTSTSSTVIVMLKSTPRFSYHELEWKIWWICPRVSFCILILEDLIYSFSFSHTFTGIVERRHRNRERQSLPANAPRQKLVSRPRAHSMPVTDMTTDIEQMRDVMFTNRRMSLAPGLAPAGLLPMMENCDESEEEEEDDWIFQFCSF